MMIIHFFGDFPVNPGKEGPESEGGREEARHHENPGAVDQSDGVAGHGFRIEEPLGDRGGEKAGGVFAPEKGGGNGPGAEDAHPDDRRILQVEGFGKADQGKFGGRVAAGSDCR